MSQSPFPFDDGGEPFELLDDDLGTSRRRTVLGVAALGATALAAAGAFLLLSGGDEEELPLGVPPSATAKASAAVDDAAVPTPPMPPAPPASSVQLGRNPFRPLLSAPTVGGAPAGSTTPPAAAAAVPPPAAVEQPGDASAVPPTVTGPALPPVGPEVPAAGGDVEDGGEPDAPSTVLLLRVTGTGTARSAVLSVDGVATTVEVGGSFGPGGELQLVSVQQGPEDGQWTAVLRAGDSDPFDVVSGVRTPLP